MRVLITGGCGFVGHHIVEHILKNTDWDILIWDCMTYASSGMDRIREIGSLHHDAEKRISVLPVDFTTPISIGLVKEYSDVDYILHLGAESHVDNSIARPMEFVVTNVIGTAIMLEFAKQCENLKAFAYFSTDEVYGPALPLDQNRLENLQGGKLVLDYSYKEWDRYNSGNPYSATKAGAEQLVLAYMNTYGTPGFIINCMNIFGERQHQEKVLPLFMKKILNHDKLIIHGDKSKEKSGARFYIHARNVSNAVLWLLDNFEQRDKYNIVGEREMTNLELAKFIAKTLNKTFEYEIVDFHSTRPGHDLRYALDGSKMKRLGWRIPVAVELSLEKTILWTLRNSQWL